MDSNKTGTKMEWIIQIDSFSAVDWERQEKKNVFNPDFSTGSRIKLFCLDFVSRDKVSRQNSLILQTENVV